MATNAEDPGPRPAASVGDGVEFAHLPIEVFARVADFLAKPSRAVFGVALTAPSSSWRRKGTRQRLSTAGEGVISPSPPPLLPSLDAIGARCKRAIEKQLEEDDISYYEVHVGLSESSSITKYCTCHGIVVTDDASVRFPGICDALDYISDALEKDLPEGFWGRGMLGCVRGAAMTLEQWMSDSWCTRQKDGEEANPLSSQPRTPEFLWDQLDFGAVEKGLASKLSDEDIRAILLSIGASKRLKSLKLDGCYNITGRGLDPLCGSTLLESLDLSIHDSPGEAPTLQLLISENAVLPILDVIIRKARSQLNTIELPNVWFHGVDFDVKMKELQSRFHRIIRDDRRVTYGCSWSHPTLRSSSSLSIIK